MGRGGGSARGAWQERLSERLTKRENNPLSLLILLNAISIILSRSTDTSYTTVTLVVVDQRQTPALRLINLQADALQHLLRLNQRRQRQRLFHPHDLRYVQFRGRFAFVPCAVLA